MCGGSFAFWFCVVLLFTSSSNNPRNFTSDNEEDNIWEETYNDTNLIRNKTNNNNKNHIVFHEKCDNITCIQLCCPLGNRLVDGDCIPEKNEYIFPSIYSYSNNSIQSENKKVDELFPILVVQNPCKEIVSFHLYPDNYLEYDNYMFFANSSLYLPDLDIFVESTSYCLAPVLDRNQFDAIICWEANKKACKKCKWGKIVPIRADFKNEIYNVSSSYEISSLFVSCRIVSILCLLTIFVVYSILPELRNMHSFILRKYCSLLFFGYIIETICFQSFCPIGERDISYIICVIIALVNYFCFISSFFWLSAMSFDMWWAFRDFRLLPKCKRAKQERKKLIYSIIAWGGPSIFTIICIIMDFVPNVPENLIRPNICVRRYWFNEDAAFLLYFYGPRIVCVISSICLSIYTALKIMRYEKDTARHLRDSESQLYNNNKRWLNLYLRLFIMMFIIMAINWIVKAALNYWPFNDDHNYKLKIK